MTCLRCGRGQGPNPSHQLANLVWCSHNPQPEEAVKNFPSSECIPSSPSSWPVKDEFPNVEQYSVCSRVKKFCLSTLLKQQEASRDSIARRALGRISKKAKQLGRNVSNQDHSNPTPGLNSESHWLPCLWAQSYSLPCWFHWMWSLNSSPVDRALAGSGVQYGYGLSVNQNPSLDLPSLLPQLWIKILVKAHLIAWSLVTQLQMRRN